MNQQRIAPASKLRRGSEHYLNGKSVWVERDPNDGTVFICDDKSLKNHHNFWWINKSDLKIAYKHNCTISKTKKKLTVEEAKEKAELDAFFEMLWAGNGHFNCQNCHKDLCAVSIRSERAVSAHIVPKSIFKSIATNKANILYLGVISFGSKCNCHPTWDSTVEKRVKMRIYPYALKIYLKELRPLLTEKESQLADEYMGITTKSLNQLRDIEKGEVKE